MSLKDAARELRRNQTDEEKALWRALRGRRFAGFKFRRQHVVGDHILDFYCADAQLAVELDGFQHGLPEGIQRDTEREKFLAEQGIETLRFWNHQWRKNREGCLMDIWNAVQKRSGWVRVMKNAEEQKFIPPDLKMVKVVENNAPSPRPSPRLAGRGRNIRALGYPDAIQFLYGLRLFGAKFGLENTFKLASLAGNPQTQLRFIHVAGTNGKGSTCAMLESIYRAAGLRVGLFTSPHLVSFRERIQVDRELISESEVTRLVGELQRLSDTAGETPAVGRRDAGPTFFEFVTVMALRYFAEQKCDLVIWETGLGGRLDATNIVTPLASVITNIGYDHQQWLGDTLEMIAAEKAGIIKPGVPVVTAADVPEALAVIREVATEKAAPLTVVASLGFPSFFQMETGATPALRLAGDHQKTNAALAVATVEVLQSRIPVGPDAVRAGLATVKWPGRLQLIERDGQRVLLDGAHNAAGATVLRAALEKEFAGARPVIIFGALADKKWDEICAILAPVAAEVYTVPVASDRTANPDDLAAAFRTANPGLDAVAAPGLTDALNACKNTSLVLITGSLYLVGEALECLGLSPANPGERALNEWSAPKTRK